MANFAHSSFPIVDIIGVDGEVGELAISAINELLVSLTIEVLETRKGALSSEFDVSNAARAERLDEFIDAADGAGADPQLRRRLPLPRLVATQAPISERQILHFHVSLSQGGVQIRHGEICLAIVRADRLELNNFLVLEDGHLLQNSAFRLRLQLAQQPEVGEFLGQRRDDLLNFSVSTAGQMNLQRQRLQILKIYPFDTIDIDP